eukprot:1158763-Pelagomonas_calceolata.AAC.3
MSVAQPNAECVNFTIRLGAESVHGNSVTAKKTMPKSAWSDRALLKTAWSDRRWSDRAEMVRQSRDGQTEHS